MQRALPSNGLVLVGLLAAMLTISCGTSDSDTPVTDVVESGQADLPNACGEIGPQGCCAGETLVWCVNGVLQEAKCASAPACGWNSFTSGYDCGTDGGVDPAGLFPKMCEERGEIPGPDATIIDVSGVDLLDLYSPADIDTVDSPADIDTVDSPADIDTVDLPDAPSLVDAIEVGPLDLYDQVDADGGYVEDNWETNDSIEDLKAPDDSDSSSSGDTIAPTGACDNSADEAIIDPDPGLILSSATDCHITCLGEDDVGMCATICLEDSTGLTSGCAQCYSEATTCVVNNCLAQCLVDPGSEECYVCQFEAGCIGAFFACTGLGADAWPDEWNDCVPDCEFKECGTDGCGGSCGGCGGNLCINGACFEGSEDCPSAVIKCPEGEEVIPQTILHLFGDDSYAANGTIQKWEWAVQQPNSSQSVFVPSHTFPNPIFETNVAGIYTFYLTVYDQTDTPSCFPAVHEVVVIPDEVLHIELSWHTPDDLDETDTGPEAGSDLDLHFTHPWAAGPDLDGDGVADGWFDIPFDCFWFNAHPNWGSYDPGINDDPGLDRDDTDGAGPENINLDIPEDATYRVGIHYWNDHGYGAAFATVRIYIYGQLVFESPETFLVDSDMWEVCTIEWPSGKVEVVTSDGDLKITPEYHNPYFFQ